jgi:hypothetical protein
MSTTTKIKATASPADVRAWARENGHEVGTRGRFAPDLIRAFNASHGLKYREAQHVPTVEVTAKPEKGRKVTRKVNISLVREAALAAGVPVGKRGRISQEVIQAYVLGTLDTLATGE